MSKIDKNGIILLFLVLVLIVGVLMNIPTYGLKIGGLFIGFEEGVAEQEAISIFGDHDLAMNYTLDYNIDSMASRHYVVVDKDEKLAVKYELRKAENWIESGHDIKKGDCYIIHIWEPVVDDEDFLEILSEQDLQLKKFVWCYVRFGDGSLDWIDNKKAKKIKKELEQNEKVLTVGLDDIEG